MTAGCAPGLFPHPPGVALSIAVARKPKAKQEPESGPQSPLQAALARVLAERFEAGEVRGLKVDLGQLFELEGTAASVKVSRLLAGTAPWPSKQWSKVAHFVKMSGPELLHAVALELARLEDEPSS